MNNETLPWVIVLAGGEGERMCPFIQQCLGKKRPKQYCAFCGNQTMLEKTLSRAGQLTSRDRLLTVIGRGHRVYLRGDLPGRLLEQPSARGTATGVFWPLSRIVSEDSEATVLILPSDHFFYPEARLVSRLREAIQMSRRYPDRVILVGVVPDDDEPEYGWIEPAGQSEADENLLKVAAFREKPSPEDARRYYDHGCLWNTMITLAPASTLWKLADLWLPELTRGLNALTEAFQETLSASDGESARSFDRMYRDLPTKDFSRELLAPAADQMLVFPLRDIYWSDWGRPERLFGSLEKVRTEFPESTDTPNFSRLERLEDCFDFQLAKGVQT